MDIVEIKETPAEETEVKTVVTRENEVSTFTAEWKDGQRLTVTKHRDGSYTLRIGRGGQGEKVKLSSDAYFNLANIF
ncbi:hypothetical protein [Bifidobacterium scaligerum]|uniref:Uncharacterized protein n=1 Tax=Bifidobacterium scaligerum TaxID=2052656 RepID=A0A2M9HT30_9BIFI|nr:hypothetical protein [Bifidobacterium scaligerum]PJM79973.1 hypothetical protein CUU80_02230 [Bifidobacterium scaligerum]